MPVCGESGRDLFNEQKGVAVDQNVTDICFAFLSAGSQRCKEVNGLLVRGHPADDLDRMVYKSGATF